jgi:hypothetical protein
MRLRTAMNILTENDVFAGIHMNEVKKTGAVRRRCFHESDDFRWQRGSLAVCGRLRALSRPSDEPARIRKIRNRPKLNARKRVLEIGKQKVRVKSDRPGGFICGIVRGTVRRGQRWNGTDIGTADGARGEE